MAQQEQDIHRVLELLIENWNTHDPDQFAASFSQDAQFTDVLGNTAEGRNEVARLHVVPFARLFQHAELGVQQTPVKFLTDDVASVSLNWTMTGSTTAQGEPWPPRNGIMHMVLVRREDRWWPVLAHNTDHTATASE